MSLLNYFATLNPVAFTNALPGNIAQGLIWGIMALGVYITFRLLDFADLTVDGSFATGGAVTVMMTINGHSIWVSLLCACIAGLLAGLCTGLYIPSLVFHPILAGILTQIALYSINLNIMDRHANQALSIDKYNLIISSRQLTHAIIVGAIFAIVLIALLYWYFGTEQGSAIRATGCNPAMSKHRESTSTRETDRSYPLQRNRCSVRRTSGTVFRLLRCQHGTWRHRYRSRSRDHRRGSR